MLVVDSSMAMAWSFVDEGGELADSVARTVGRTGAIVPLHWHLEVANTLAVNERRGRLRPEDSLAIIVGLEQLPITVDPETYRRTFHDTLNLARKHQLTSYDAAYLELAVRLGLRLATMDKALRAAAEVEGVALLGLAA